MIAQFFVWWFRIKGWKVEGTIPHEIRKAVVIAAPHTSQWDFIYSLAAFKILGLKVNYLAKKELFRFPFKQILKATGGIPVQREKHEHVVDLIATKLKLATDLYMMIPAEGTRKKVNKWKSGFYHAAAQANVPVMPGYLNYKTKRAGFGPPIYLSGDKEKDMQIVREFYSKVTPKHPERFDPEAIRLD